MALTDHPPELVPKEPAFHTFTITGGPMAKDVAIFLDGVRLKGVTSVQINASYDDVVRVEVSLIGLLGESQVIAAPTVKQGLTLKEIEEGSPHLSQIVSDLSSLHEG